MSEQTEMRIKMKTLVLAEKPSVGRDIGRVLHCTPQGNGFLEGKIISLPGDWDIWSP